jgi:type IV secretion system protein VirB6
MAKGFFEKASIDVMRGLDQLTQGYQEALSGDVSTIFTAAASLYILWMGYYIMAGKTQTPVQDLVWRCVAMMMIMTFVDYSSGYLSLVEGAVDGLKAGLSGEENIWQHLDKVWEKAQILGSALKSEDPSTFPIDGAIAQGLVWGGAIILLSVGSLIFLSAEITLKLLLLVAPLFIFFLMWGFLRTMFNNWLQAIFSSLLTIMFASLVMGMAVEFQMEMLSTINEQVNRNNLVTMGAMGALAGILSAGMVFISSQLASRLAGVGVDGVVQGLAVAGAATGLWLAKKGLETGAKGIGKLAEAAKMPNKSSSGGPSGMTRAEQNAERLKRKRGY